MDPSPLPLAPSHLVFERGIPAFGQYQGSLSELSWSFPNQTVLQRITAKLRHKRWLYLALQQDDFFVCLAIVDLGWGMTAFANCFNRKTGQASQVFDSPPITLKGADINATPFTNAHFENHAGKIHFSQTNGRIEVSIQSKAFSLLCHIQAPKSENVLLAIAPANYLAHATHKTGALKTKGHLRFHQECVDFKGATAWMDSSDGYLAHHTEWRWASAHQNGLGFNLQAGYMGEAENALWLNDQIYLIEQKIEFDFDPKHPEKPWHIYTKTGEIDLIFTPEGVWQDQQNYYIVKNRYSQPFGHFDGYIRHPHTQEKIAIQQLFGVAEDHDSYW